MCVVDPYAGRPGLLQFAANLLNYGIGRPGISGNWQWRARLDIQINDRFGNPVVPQEWFLVPVFIIDEVVEKIKDNTLSNYKYDIESACLVKG